jgi:tRNA(Ile)-lysidine synthase TilS/MesJ
MNTIVSWAGLDSSYLAYLGYKWGLRILAIHVDDGFDTKVSKNNLKKLCEKANIKMITIKPDAEQLNDLTKAIYEGRSPEPGSDAG